MGGWPELLYDYVHCRVLIGQNNYKTIIGVMHLVFNGLGCKNRFCMS